MKKSSRSTPVSHGRMCNSLNEKASGLIKIKLDKFRSVMGDFLLLLAAMIWGMGFVARRIGSLEAPPFTFNGLRFLIGAIFLLPFLLAGGMKRHLRWNELSAGMITGSCLFIGTNLQQIGLKWTDAGRAAFISALYVVLVPLISIFLGRKVNLFNILGALLALSGLFFLSPWQAGSLNQGDVFMILCSIMYAIYIILVGKFSPECSSLGFSFATFVFCGILSLIPGLSEKSQWTTLSAVLFPLLYSGLFVVGVGYSLQVTAQRFTLPSHAAIIMSLEAVFAVIFGFMILKESLSLNELIGCILMFLGFIVVQADKLKATYDSEVT